MQELIKRDLITPMEAEFIVEKLKSKHNIIVLGHVGAGKTTLLRALIKAADALVVNMVNEEDRVAKAKYQGLLTDWANVDPNKVIALIPEIVADESIQKTTELLRNNTHFVATSLSDKSGNIFTKGQSEFQEFNEALSRSNVVYVLVEQDINKGRKVTRIF